MNTSIVTIARRLGVASLFMLPPAGGAFAHTAERGLVMLLPTHYYLWGGALAVLVSFVVLAGTPSGAIRAWSERRLRIPVVLPDWSLVTQTIGFLAFVLLIYAGFKGVRDPLLNPLPLMLWTVGWIGFTTLAAFVDGVWRMVNPWSAPVRVLRRVLGPAPFALPTWVGYGPAIIGFAAIAWFEIVALAPDDPAVLARAVLLYWSVQGAAMLLFGERIWCERGEALSVYFTLLGRLAILSRCQMGWSLALPGARIRATRSLGSLGWLFVVATVSGVTFDGLSGTFWWLGLNGINPLEFPGRSAVIGLNTLGLLGVWVLMALSFWVAVAAGWLLAAREVSLGESLGRLSLSLLPIALAYHGAHYLTIFLVNGQYALIALSDPFANGVDWLGLGQHSVTTSFLNDMASVTLIWRIQAGIVIAGHVIAVIAAHAVAHDLYTDRRRAAFSQWPLAGLMVGYTVLGLWLLSTPTGA